jgi:thiamine pyrophosphokinase
MQGKRLGFPCGLLYHRRMHALVIANGMPVSLELLRSLASDSDIVVAADGGHHHAIEADIAVDAVVGDLDSIGPARAQLAVGVLHEDANPNATDLQKAVEYALASGATIVRIACAGGGRADHALANLSILTMFRGRGAVTIVDDQFEVSLVDGRSVIEAPAGTVVSLVAIGLCTGVSTTGMRWDLADHTLPFSPYGVHNEVRESPASVAVATGDLLLFRGRWVEKHR